VDAFLRFNMEESVPEKSKQCVAGKMPHLISVLVFEIIRFDPDFWI